MVEELNLCARIGTIGLDWTCLIGYHRLDNFGVLGWHGIIV